ncbi:uncharacterized protein LOC103507307 isoform X2 [Diaphorina citri]|uniref:Odorant receptor n=1 Tax=Diaphorina citri TaxID=121845 RepID=A0A1S4E9L7_DIACI|nr:uncharacterized protein LOC103507307 isoform X2 [Diaphorina citri]
MKGNAISVGYSGMFIVFLLFGVAHILDYILILRYHAKTAKYTIYTLYFLVRSSLQVAMCGTMLLKKPKIFRLYTDIAESNRVFAKSHEAHLETRKRTNEARLEARNSASSHEEDRNLAKTSRLGSRRRTEASIGTRKFANFYEARAKARKLASSAEARIGAYFKRQTTRVVRNFTVFVTVTCSILVLNSKFYSMEASRLMFPSFAYAHCPTSTVFGIVYMIQLTFLIQIIATQSLLMYIFVSAINELISQMQILQYKLQGLCCPPALLLARSDLKHGDEIVINVTPVSVDEAWTRREILGRLHEAVAHHGKIIVFKNRIEEIFGSPILVFTLINECYLCLLGYSLAIQSESTFVAKLKIIFMIITSLILTFLHCLYGEKLRTEGDRLSSAIYFVPWYDQDRQFKKCLLLMNEMSKKKITISPHRIKDIGLPLLVQVINTIFSLYNVISAAVN